MSLNDKEAEDICRYFNPRSHEGSDRYSAASRCSSSNFNPRSHEGSDCAAGGADLRGGEFQSTLPRRERLPGCVSVDALRTISIHAPTKGATRCSAGQGANDCISIHAPTKGATGHKTAIMSLLRISIHAPTKGATLKSIEKKKKRLISIHAPTKGATRQPV